MASEEQGDVEADKPGRIVVDSSKWGGCDLPDLAEELEALPPEERREQAHFYRILFFGLVALAVAFVWIGVPRAGTYVLLPLLFFLICGGLFAFKRQR